MADGAAATAPAAAPAPKEPVLPALEAVEEDDEFEDFKEESELGEGERAAPELMLMERTRLRARGSALHFMGEWVALVLPRPHLVVQHAPKSPLRLQRGATTSSRRRTLSSGRPTGTTTTWRAILTRS
jgi:hypothetical protein